MRRVMPSGSAALVVGLSLGLASLVGPAAGAWATGQPNQSCQAQLASPGLSTKAG
jgi:hypothetical protein